ncbi:MAG: diguanylate cyclase [Acidobacteriaceae bacterium]
MKILIADDDSISRRIMERMLQQIGYEVIVADNGIDAAEKLLDNDGPRLALLDWMMPQLDGPQVCRQVRAAGERRYVYLALLTSKDSRDDLVAGLDAGADDYLIKPCNPAELRARLRTGERILQLEDTLVASREDMRFRATHDALTGVWNRGTILEFLREALDHHEPTAALLCDVDHFKGVNDTFGHQAGDAVLREVAARLRGAVRAGDGIGRYGGEEFLVVLRNCDIERLRERAEQLRRAVSENSFLANGANISVSVSIGAARRKDDPPATIESILSLADDRLYRAKNAGRNRVMMADLAVMAEMA